MSRIQKLILLITALVIAIAAVVSILYRQEGTQVTQVDTDNDPSTYMFAADDLEGWWRGGGESTSPYRKIGITLHTDRQNDEHSCFVDAGYHKGLVDVTAELNRRYQAAESGGHIVTPTDIKELTMQTSGEPLQYELHQSTVTMSDNQEKLMGGQGFGFIQLTDGYIRIMGYCEQPEDLPGTLPALESIRFNGEHLANPDIDLPQPTWPNG